LFYIYGDENGGMYIQDHDGTDGKVGLPGRGIDNAGIVLPYDMDAESGVGNGGAWDCQIYVRLLGPNKPGDESSFWWKSEYYDEDLSAWILISDFKMERDTKFSLKNSLILADGYQDVLWTWYDLNKFRIAQFRIILGAPPVEE